MMGQVCTLHFVSNASMVFGRTGLRHTAQMTIASFSSETTSCLVMQCVVLQCADVLFCFLGLGLEKSIANERKCEETGRSETSGLLKGWGVQNTEKVNGQKIKYNPLDGCISAERLFNCCRRKSLPCFKNESFATTTSDSQTPSPVS